jgi:hypothetical protein
MIFWMKIFLTIVKALHFIIGIKFQIMIFYVIINNFEMFENFAIHVLFMEKNWILNLNRI